MTTTPRETLTKRPNIVVLPAAESSVGLGAKGCRVKSRWIVKHFVQPSSVWIEREPVLMWTNTFRHRWRARFDCWIGNHIPPGPLGEIFFATMRPEIAGVDTPVDRTKENARPRELQSLS